MTQGRCDWLGLHRTTLAFATPHRFIPALPPLLHKPLCSGSGTHRWGAQGDEGDGEDSGCNARYSGALVTSETLIVQSAGDVSYSEAGISVRNTKQLWDMPVVFLLLLGLPITEWLLRRNWGVI